MLTALSGILVKAIMSASRMLAPLVVLGVVGAVVYMFAGPLIVQYWPIGLIILAVLMVASSEFGHLRYTMQRNHTDFMCQTKGYRPIDDEPDSLYFID